MANSLEEAWDAVDGPAVRQVTAVVVGCGQRGQNYAAFALDFPSRLKIVGLAEPVSNMTEESGMSQHQDRVSGSSQAREDEGGVRTGDEALCGGLDRPGLHAQAGGRRHHLHPGQGPQGPSGGLCQGRLPRPAGEADGGD